LAVGSDLRADRQLLQRGAEKTGRSRRNN